MKKSVLITALLLLGFLGFGQDNKPYVIRYQSQDDIIQHNTQFVSGIHIDSLGQTLIHNNGVEWSSLDDLDTVYIYRGYFRIQQTDLQNWDFGIVSYNNNVVLVKEEDDYDGSSHVLILMHQTEDTLSFTYQNDTLTDFYYNSYHFMVSEIDTMLLFTTIDGDMAVSYIIPSEETIIQSNTKGNVLTILDQSVNIINRIFTGESLIHIFNDFVISDWESFGHDLGEMIIENEVGGCGPVGAGVVLSYEIYKHYIDHLHNKALRFHLGNASCTIQSIQQNESTNMIDVTVAVINGEDIPDYYLWKNYWGQQVTSPNYVYYGVVCRAGNNFPTIQKFDYYRIELLEPHASILQTFSFPIMAVEKILFRPFLCFRYEYHNTALQNGYKKASLAKYGAVEAFYPEFEINTIASPLEGGIVTEGGRYHFNTQITLTATANSHYEFTHWEDGSALNPRVITVEGDATYTAYFDGPLFDINILASPSEGGTVGGSGRYPANTTIITTATANSGYEFTHWEDGSESNPRVIIVEGDATYTAYFEEQLYDIITIASPSEGGTVTGGGSYPANTIITLTATANNCYEFTHWEDGSESNPRVITVEGDATYTAYFEEVQPSLPDLSGTWTCTETHYSSNGEPYYTSYEITFFEDGTVDCPTYPVISEGLSPGTYSVGNNGGVSISIHQISQYTNYWYDSGVEWQGNIEDLCNPTTITGYRYNWRYNNIGYFQGDSVEFVMTR